MAYILLLLLVSASGPQSSVEVGRFKKQADCNDAAAKSTYTHRQGPEPSFSFVCVAAGDAAEMD
jgi:hypothetical protein